MEFDEKLAKFLRREVHLNGTGSANRMNRSEVRQAREEHDIGKLVALSQPKSTDSFINVLANKGMKSIVQEIKYLPTLRI